ncbi:MAG: hypothetical protein GX858_01935 [Clostridiales bacterium]|jgi:ribosomal protein L7Ae-like RNA K-turn-binding protein|nr:hypothetical protein [Clostridiales bacterium]
MLEQKLRGLLGLATRAGQMLIGSGRALEHVRQEKSRLVFMDEAASDNTKKRFTDACQSHQADCRVLSKGLLGQAIGKPGTMVVAVLPGGMADKIIEAINNLDNKILE